MVHPQSQSQAGLIAVAREPRCPNTTSRELTDVTQPGLYAGACVTGLEVLRHGIIRAHNSIIARPR